ncbi:ROK family transcriptional regulator [Sphingomonas sp. HHU CXW]|uniref:ROK family transcriptional regulator n=1 Tax=Sphingomonas hominis TaxID=2741495 RepID=A0ABX2JDR1_9SPHN|nr:ROK family transcriptional regulator [Sphingomonas hominis]NTS64550.1 ROK family transcriptional regulator [Sphingomonas hominis]
MKIGEARLNVSLSGTNLERAGDYNQRVVLQAIRLNAEVTRSDLVELTGLTVPTIANITRRLVAAGLARTAGRLQRGRGQPAVRLAIDPNGAFGIGINIDRDHLTLVVLDLSGQVRARVARDIAYALPDDVRAFVAAAMDTIRASSDVAFDRVIGVGVAVPEPFSKANFHDQPAGYAAWNDVDITALLQDLLAWPIHVDNDAAAAALGELEFGSRRDCSNFFYLLLSAGLGGGLVVDGSYYRGAGARSGEIGFIVSRHPGADDQPIEARVSLSALYHRLSEAGCASGSLDALAGADAHARAVIAAWIDEAATLLVDPLIALNCLLNPEAVLIGGRMPAALIDELVAALNARLAPYAPRLPSLAPVRRATMAADAPAVGAALLPFSARLLPSDAILMNTGQIAATNDD